MKNESSNIRGLNHQDRVPTALLKMQAFMYAAAATLRSIYPQVNSHHTVVGQASMMKSLVQSIKKGMAMGRELKYYVIIVGGI